MFYLIYKITNNLNNKEYIGSHKTNNIHDSYMGSGIAIRDAIKKYGKENFTKEILHVFDTPDEMFAKEREIVTEDYIKRSDTYNLMVGGLGAGPGHLNPFYGKKHRPESIQQNIQTQKVKYENGHINAFKGKTHSEETKQHWSEIRKGKRKGTENSFFGKEHSEESKLKMSQIAKTRKQPTPEQRAHFLYITPYGTFYSSNKAAEICGCAHGNNIIRRCKSTRPKWNGYYMVKL